VWNSATSTWGAWVSEGAAITNVSAVWSLKDVDLTAFAGEVIRVGWYIDDLSIVSASPAFTGDFETGWGDWGAGNGLWQVGTPTAGPTNCFSGTQCAGTVLDGNYPGLTDSRMVSASTQLPTVSGAEEVHLRFQPLGRCRSPCGILLHRPGVPGSAKALRLPTCLPFGRSRMSI